MWVAESDDGAVRGCLALRGGDEGFASLGRLAGESLPELVGVAVAHAADAGYRAIEVVIPPGAEDIRETAVAHGFAPADDDDGMLYRRVLTAAP
jgi:hypothetical protein